MLTTERDFIHWLKGVLEITGDNLTTEQVQKIRTKLDALFIHAAEPPKEATYCSTLGGPAAISGGALGLLQREPGIRC